MDPIFHILTNKSLDYKKNETTQKEREEKKKNSEKHIKIKIFEQSFKIYSLRRVDLTLNVVKSQSVADPYGSVPL